MQILFRCDASETIGSGHLVRCRNLARELKKNGVNCLFICRKSKNDFITILEKEFKVLKLKNISKYYSNNNQIDDCAETLNILEYYSKTNNKLSVDCIIIDHYQLDEIWHYEFFSKFNSKFKSSKIKDLKICVIDDLANRKYFSDILVDQSVFGQLAKNRYINKLKKDCIQLLGPSFSLLSSEYEYLNKIVPYRRDFKRLFVFLGAKPQNNFISNLIEVLKLSEFKRVSKDFLFFSENNINDDLADIVKKDRTFSFYNSLPSIAGLVIRSDIAVGAGGTSNWERYCLGLPTLLVSVAKNQDESIHSVCYNGISEYLGEVDYISKDKIYNALNKKVINKNNLIYNESTKINKIVDGKGAKRVTKYILNLIE